MNKGQRAGEGSIVVEVEQDKSYYWCTCGQSKNQPFCDGSHKVTGYSNVPYKAIKDEIVFFCGCKKSSNKPLCDSQPDCKSD